MTRVTLYRSFFNKLFFFDKFSFKNVYQCPAVTGTIIKAVIPAQLKFKSKFYKLLVFFYLLSGQKPFVLVENYSVRGVKKKRISGVTITLRKKSFKDFISLRQLALITFFKGFSIKKLNLSVSFDLVQQIQDDDYFLQLLKITESFKYRVSLQTTASTNAFLKTLLLNFKVPC